MLKLLMFALLIFLFVMLIKQFKQLIRSEINGYHIKSSNGLFEVRKDKATKAQFITKESALHYCHTH